MVGVPAAVVVVRCFSLFGSEVGQDVIDVRKQLAGPFHSISEVVANCIRGRALELLVDLFFCFEQVRIRTQRL